MPAECQTSGGYPRIGTVLHFRLWDVAEADATTLAINKFLRALQHLRQAMFRDPHDIADLLGYQLVSGVTAGNDLERDEDGYQG